VALKVSELPVVVEVEDGVTLTDVTVAVPPPIVTVALAILLVSAWLKTLIVAVPVVEGAVYKPFDEMVPVEALQVTAVFAEVVVTVALN
jgi:hypothetical protein